MPDKKSPDIGTKKNSVILIGMAAPNKQIIIDEIAKDIAKGVDRGKIITKFCKKFQKSARTIDSYLKKAKKQQSELQEKAKEAANDVYIQKTVEAAESTIMTEIEAKKVTTEIARGNLADYMVIRTVEYTPRIQISLFEFIQRLTEEVKFEDEFADLAGYNADEMKDHVSRQAQRQRNILRYQLELNKNPTAVKITDGPTEWRQVAELDMVKLVADKEKGKIKSLAHTPHGIKIEMYSAEAATTTMLKLHGSFPPAKVAQTDTDGNDVSSLDRLSAEELNYLLLLQEKANA